MTTSRTVRIGGASAFIVDSATAVPQLLRSGPIDYLAFDFLAEGSMGRFAQAGDDNGFAPDFISVHMAPNLAEILARKVKVIANAGGVNPRACAAALEKAAAALGLKPRIAYVEGDDLRARIDEIRRDAPAEMFDGRPFPEKVNTINAYLGGFPIAQALAGGADIVITGRAVDSAMTLGPLIHEFGWGPDDFDRLAAGTAIGHLIECGTQVTGGTFTDWRDVEDWSDVGFPIAECAADGSCVITKPAGTGGLVSVGTVAEQLMYEVSDPQAYFVPDVTCDFSTIRMEQVGPHRVRVWGATGRAPTSTYKVCITYQDGWRTQVFQPIIGMEAPAKARRQAEAIVQRTSRMLRAQNLGEWRQTHIEVLGAESIYGPRGRAEGAREVIMKLVADHDDPSACGLMAREAGAAITAMSVGTTIGFMPSVAPLSHLFSFLLEKERVSISVTVDGRTEPCEVPTRGGFAPAQIRRPEVPPNPAVTGTATVPLLRLAFGRSGDKGDLFNVALIARRPEWLPYIRAALTTDAVRDWYGHLFCGPERRVDRYEVPGIHALNFVVHDVLWGGINASPRLDPVAKGMAQQLLEFPVPVPDDLARALTAQAH